LLIVEEAGQTTTLSGLKFVAPVEQTFLQKYGMMMAMSEFFVFCFVKCFLQKSGIISASSSFFFCSVVHGNYSIHEI
jgi:hypothetical protein